MIKSLKNLWGRFLFRGKGILPTKKLIYGLVFLSIILIAFTFLGVNWIVIGAVNLLVILASLIDLTYSPKRKELTFKRHISGDFERNKQYQIEIDVMNKSEHATQMRIVDDLPQSFERPFPVTGMIPAKEGKLIRYNTSAPIRGKYAIKKLYVRFTSMLGLWEKQQTIELNNIVKVIPDITEVKSYLDNAQQFLLYEGLKIRKQRTGMGEFASIRNYVVGDDPRMINWHQTAKLQEVMTNEYEPEHGKYITVLIDCGRMMGMELKNKNRLERVLESALTVIAAALQKGDYVAVIAFSKDVKVYIPPEKGLDHLQTILNALYDLQVDAVESNYREVFHYVETVLNKRSLLFLFSDVRTFLNEESMLAHLIRLRQRHLFFMIGIEDETLLKRAQDKPGTADQAMIKSMAQHQLLIKKREKARWEKQGLQLVEAKEEHVTATAVSHYIDLMNRSLL